MWSGASACVPTCGLEVNVDTFTLAPAPISDAQPQVNGVSPGHSGVSGLRVTLMSRRASSSPFMMRTPLQVVSFTHELLRGLDHVVDGDSEVGIDCRRRSRRTEALITENYSVVADPAVPRHWMRSFHRDPLHSFGQHRGAVRLVLLRKNLQAGHAH